MKADPRRSEGARVERAAFRAYLRRLLKRLESSTMGVTDVAQDALHWVLMRQKRYAKRPGGL